jgi:hypothetical protein
MMMRFRLPLAAATLLISASAHAAHCAHGNIFRVHLNKCVDRHSPLAHVALSHSRRRVFASHVAVEMKHPGTVDSPSSDVPGSPADSPLLDYRLDGSLMSRTLRVYWRLPP